MSLVFVTTIAGGATAALVSATAVGVTRYQLQADKQFYVPYEGANAQTRRDFPDGFLPAYGSGIAFRGKAADGSLEFYAITDRGPNGEGPAVARPGARIDGKGVSKVFPAPSFAPGFGRVSVGKDGAVLRAVTPLRRDATHKLTGLPPQSGIGSTGETPLTDGYVFDPAKADFDADGLDPESLVFDKARNVLWTSDEYGPFLARIDIATGVVQRRYVPGTAAGNLPAVLAQRRANRGMEGLTLDAASGRLHGVLQSPIDPLDAAGKSIKAKPPGGRRADVRHLAKFVRWLDFDPDTATSRMYAYPIDGRRYEDGRTGNAKLGDLASLGQGRFIVIEQGARAGDGKAFNKLMLAEIPADATDIAALGADLEISSIAQAAVGNADYRKVVPLKTTELLDLNALGWTMEKAEGLARVDDHTLALIGDNDFGLTTVLLDAAGNVLRGSVDDCAVDAGGRIANAGKDDCPAGAAGARIARARAAELPTHLWLIRFDRKLADFRIPGGR